MDCIRFQYLRLSFCIPLIIKNFISNIHLISRVIELGSKCYISSGTMSSLDYAHFAPGIANDGIVSKIEI